MPKKTLKTLLALAIIILLGFLLRVYNIGQESFWLDEGAAAFAMKTYNIREILYNTIVIGNLLPGYYSASTDPPVYYIMLYFWSRIFGVSEIGLRFFSSAVWILSAVFLYLTAKKLLGGKNALYSTALFSISIPAIAFSQEARGYMLYLFFALASIYYLLKALDKNKSLYWILYAVFVVLGSYTHHLFVILLVFQALYAALSKMSELRSHVRLFKKYDLDNKDNKNLLKIFVTCLIIGLLLIPIIPRVLKEKVDWWGKPTITSTSSLLANFASWAYPTGDGKEKLKNGLFFEMQIIDILLFASVILTVIISYSLILYLAYKNLFVKNSNVLFLFSWFAFPLTFAFLLSIFTPISIFTTFHYFFYCLPPFIMLLAEALRKIKAKHAIAFFLLLNIIPLYSYYHNTDKQQWREAAEFLKGKVSETEPIIISIYSGEVSLRYYYGNYGNIHGVRKLDDNLKALVKDKDSLWLILTFWKYLDPEGSVQKYINENYKIAEHKKFFDIDIYLYKKK